MATIVFDFDSTLIPVESLEEVLQEAAGTDPGTRARIEEITRRGMEGELDFRTSLESRVAIAPPTRPASRSVGLDLADRLTPGAVDCVTSLRDAGHEVRIVSGGLREVILPSARRLGIPDELVHAVSVVWDNEGRFGGFVEDGFIDSKVEGVRRLDPDWPRPIVAVGDGATDHALATSGLADAFIAFTGHVRRDFVARTGVPFVDRMSDLSEALQSLVPPSSPPPETHD